MARTNISVDQNVFDAFSAEAARQNKTLFAFANESLTVVTKVASEGGTPSELYGMWRSVTLLKQFDVITLPADFVDDVTAELYASHKEATLKRFSEIGSRFVSVLKIFAPELSDLTTVEKDFRGLLPIKNLAIKEQGKGILEIDVVGAGRRIESTECAREFLIAIARGYGYTVTRQETNIGTIRLWVTSRGLP
ncbi:MAG: hypothetical protein OK441_02735 [Thaumarchaeota archaeon]|nr:hypothetical protein [Nitrososphaerota archaeon]